MTDLLTWSQTKFNKATEFGYFNVGHHLSPAERSGFNVCGDYSPECKALCLNTSGQGEEWLLKDGVQTVQLARIWRTKLLFADKVAYVDLLKHEIGLRMKKATRMGKKLCMRLNATSDLPWEKFKGSNGLTVLEEFPSTQFYDYTKSQRRALAFVNGDLPSNYFLTFSRDERPQSEAFSLTYLGMGGRVAVCMRLGKSDPVPETWHGFECTDGDLHDLRFLDIPGMVTVLRPKGSKAKKAVDSLFFIKEKDWVA